MNYNFYLVDDDISVISILSHIIVNENLGDVIGKATSGQVALDEIPRLNPDIVIVDLLLPKVDGITLVSKLKERFPETPFVMISEVFAKDMVSKAYHSGVSFFINKPINVIEVINVLKRVDEILKMKKVISSFQQAFQSFQTLDSLEHNMRPVSDVELATDVLNDIGILSEAGSKDILNIITFLYNRKKSNSHPHVDFKLNDLYAYLSDKYEREQGEMIPQKTIEQRIRRAVTEAMANVATFGLDDYDHYVFERYASVLFDFKEIRKEMDFIKKGIGSGGKVSIKKFVVGLLNEIVKTK